MVRAADVARDHIESFKLALAARPGRRGQASVGTIRHKLGLVRTFFERIIEWEYPDAPRRVPIFAGDFPKADEPLPPFWTIPSPPSSWPPWPRTPTGGGASWSSSWRDRHARR